METPKQAIPKQGTPRMQYEDNGNIPTWVEHILGVLCFGVPNRRELKSRQILEEPRLGAGITLPQSLCLRNVP